MISVKKLNKYKLVLRPLILVLVLDMSLLFTNFYIAADLEASAVSINLAGRQRMLSQKMTKSLAFMELSNYKNLEKETHLNELKRSVFLFNQTLNAFYKGGDATSASGELINISKLSDTKSKILLQDALEIWQPTFIGFEILFNSQQELDRKYTELLFTMKSENLQLLKLMNDLTNHLQVGAEKRTYFLRVFQALIVITIFLSFLQAARRYAKRELYYSNLMEKTTDVVMSFDVRSGLLTFVSVSTKQVLGYNIDDLEGNTAKAFMTPTSLVEFEQLLMTIRETGKLSIKRIESEFIKADGSKLFMDAVLELTESEDASSVELSADFRDISERKLAEQQLRELAHKDSLTGLSNRHTFIELLEHAIQLSKRDDKTLAVLFVDVDGFKFINDSYGHETGDELLIEIAHRMKASLRNSDHVARMGGDEFTVLLEDVRKKDEVTMVAEKLLMELSKPYLCCGHTCHVTASIGCAFYQDETSASELIRNADQAMYQVKFNGKNSIGFE
jgi:diguanylate cyclase (GGDEF)-like protein/PAS domain S-box-containing protein